MTFVARINCAPTHISQATGNVQPNQTAQRMIRASTLRSTFGLDDDFCGKFMELNLVSCPMTTEKAGAEALADTDVGIAWE
jgi:hypothetical protein